MATHKKATEENVITMEELEKMCESTTEEETKELAITCELSCKAETRAKNVVRKLKAIANVEIIGDKDYEAKGTTFRTYDVGFKIPVSMIAQVCDALCIYPEDGTFKFPEYI